MLVLVRGELHVAELARAVEFGRGGLVDLQFAERCVVVCAL